VLIFVLGVPAALSNNLLKDWHLIGSRNFLDSVDFLSTNYLLPLGGLLITLFAGWVLTPKVAREELLKGGGSQGFYRIWYFLIRYISPVLVALVLLNKIGLF
jgi:NSS family neurotransmitter:Na+ symporter